MDYSRFSLRLVIKLIIMLGLGMFSFQSVLADIPLNSLNRLGSDGAYYWIIRVPGTYYLDIPESSFITSSEVAIWIAASDVTLDGRGKIISGPSAPLTSTGSGVYGVRVNGGQTINNVKVKILR